jgi:DNA-binding NarL/FixJ family response regulator
VANILLYSSSPQWTNHCREHLAPTHSVKTTESVAIASIADIVLIDSYLLDKKPELLNKIRRFSCLCLIVGNQWPEYKQVRALLQGASGYIECQELTLLSKAIESIQKGEIWIHRNLVPQVIKQLTLETESQRISPTDKLKLSSLSKREIDVAGMIATGQNNKQIARQLNISERTVKAHLTSIFKKLNISDRLHLALLVKESQY